MIMNRFTHLLSAFATASVLALGGCSGVTDSTGGPHAAEPEQPVVSRFDPTVPRLPKPSKSLTIGAESTPPAPSRVGATKRKPRVQPSKQWGAPAPSLGRNPSDAEVRAASFMPEPLRPVPGASTAMETDALADALREEWSSNRRIDALGDFLRAYPASRWAPVLHLNLGKLSYQRGFFQDALAHWKAVWELAKDGDDQVSKDLANLALAESAKMNARIGRQSEVEALLAEAQKRTLMGDARVKIGSAAEGAWMMRHRPGVSFRCGPYALLSVARELNLEDAKRTAAFLDKTQSPSNGFSIPEVERMSAELGLKLQLAKREIGAPMVVPAVVHWTLGHFAAVVREVDGKFLLKDPTFGEDALISAEAVDREASGYFLVPAGPLPSGWSRATLAETAKLYGKGYAGVIDDATAASDHKVGGSCQSGLAMATYQFHTLAASLHIEDTPVGYSAAVGPDVRLNVAYNQREAGQPSAIDFTNFGPSFVNNWVSYSSEGINVSFVAPGGGSYSRNVGSSFPADGRRGEHIEPLQDGSGVNFKVVFPDGRADYYEHSVGGTTVNGLTEERRIFISRRADPQGNEAIVKYDCASKTECAHPTRIDRIIDATGLETVFEYGYPGEPYLVTAVEDPYGRRATFTYVQTAGAVRLQSIEDVAGTTAGVPGIISAFTYNEAGEIDSMTTPYGTTTFNLSGPYVNTGQDLIRYAEATDPLGQTERVEFNMSATLTGVQFGPPSPQPDPAVITVSSQFHDARNSFYWDKLLMKLAPGDHQKAYRYHWLHKDDNTVTGVLEAEVAPLESPLYYSYPGQSRLMFEGSLASPSVIARVVKDELGADKTQATKLQYNAKANVDKVTDPLGRETAFDYDTNGVDVLAVKQKTGGTASAPVYTTITSYSYGSGAPPHRPRTMTDGAGNVTTFDYSSTTGLLEQITNAKNEVTTFAYQPDPTLPGYRRVISITGDVAGGNRTFTYDDHDRVRTTTDSEAYTLTYDYDDLDRLRRVTYPDGTFEQREYQDHSMVASRDREGRWTRHMYNGNMERVLTQDPALRTTQFQWCRCGALKRFVDGNGNVTAWDRDERARITKKTNANATSESYYYDNRSGRLQTAIDAKAQSITYSYYVDDRPFKTHYSDSSTADLTYEYDTAFPRVTKMSVGSAAPTTTLFGYHPYGASTNGAGQVALVDGPLTNDTLKHTYDELGRLKKLEIVDDATQTTASYSEEYVFDNRGRATSVVNNLGTTTYGFVGQSSRPLTVDHANGMKTQFDYFTATTDFALKQIKNVTAASAPISQFDYFYRPDRSIDTWTVDQGSGANTWKFGYSDARELTSATFRDAAQAVLESNTYGYDKAGNRIEVGPGTTAPKNYETNGVNELLSERGYGKTTIAGFVDEPATVKINGKPAKVLSSDGGAPFKFEASLDLDAGANTVVVEATDAQNNKATKTYSVPTTGTTKKYEYDLNGNLLFEKDQNSAPLREFRWDQDNRLVRTCTGACGPGTPTRESVYEYDGASRRVRIKELTNGVETKNETFVWCGSQICQKRSSNGATVLRSYFGNGFEQGTDRYFYTTDQLGSVREVIRADGSTIAARLSYDPWGKVTETGSVLTDFGFTGHHYDRSTGLHLALYRAYDPIIGRWISRDPIGLAGGSNDYRYVSNDPLNAIDPQGLSSAPSREQLTWVAELLGVENTAALINEHDAMLSAVGRGDVDGAECHAKNAAEAAAKGVVEIGVLGISMGGGGRGSRMVNPRSLRPTHDGLTGNRIEKLRKAMKRTGYDSRFPIEAWEIEGKLYIADGHHRTQAAIRAGLNEVPVLVSEPGSLESAKAIVSDFIRTLGDGGPKW